MWPRGLLLGIALLGLFAGGQSQLESFAPVGPIEPEPILTDTCDIDDSSVPVPPQCKYFLVSSMVLTSLSKAPICLNLERCDETVNVTVTAEFFLELRTIIRVDGVTEYFGCIDFDVPEVNETVVAFLTVVITSSNINIQSRKRVIFDKTRVACVTQKNQPKIEPGQTVITKTVCYDDRMMQVIKNFVEVTFSDTNGNLISQDLNPVMENGMLSWSYTFSPKARPGSYMLTMTDDKNEVTTTYIEVQDNTLQRWDWINTCPGPISVMDKEAEITGQALYDYNKAVAGKVMIKCCRRMPRYGNVGYCFKGIDDFCHSCEMPLDEHGNFTLKLKLEMFKLYLSGPEDSISCEMIVEEEGTGELITKNCWMWISRTTANLQLDNGLYGEYYNRCGRVKFGATLTNEKGEPLYNKNITVMINGRTITILTTDKNGRVTCRINTSKYSNPNITLSAAYFGDDICFYNPDYSGRSYPFVEVTMPRLHSYSGSSVCVTVPQDPIAVHSTIEVEAEYKLTEDGVGEGVTTVTLMYLIRGKNKLVKCVKVPIDLSGGYTGSISFEVNIDENCALGAQLMVVITLKGEVVTHTGYLNVGAGFKNEVTLEADPDVVLPGDVLNHTVTAGPHSVCSFRGFNDAFNRLYYYDPFNTYGVISNVMTYMWGYQYDQYNFEEPDPQCVDPDTEIFCNGGYYKATSNFMDGEPFTDFQENSFILLTNLECRRRRVCGEPEPYSRIMYFDKAAAGGVAEASPGGGQQTVTTFRDDFRNSVGLQLIILDDKGEGILRTLMPQKLARWDFNGFCVSPELGLGMPLQSSYATTFQAFFVTGEFPDRVYKDEEVNIAILVSYYSKGCGQVKLAIQSDTFGALDVTPADNEGEQCVCSEETKFWTFRVKCNTIGSQRVSISATMTSISAECGEPNDPSLPLYEDTIVVEITVKPPGIERTSTCGRLLQAEGSTDSATIEVLEPENLEPGTFGLQIMVTGDPLVLCIKNLNQFLEMPIGCCEQELSTMIPIALIAKYLQEKGELDEETLNRVRARLQEGYGNQLSCILGSGRYSLYRSTSIPNTMVSLQALWAFSCIDQFVFVDPNILLGIIGYLGLRQNIETGCVDHEGSTLSYEGEENADIQTNCLIIIRLHGVLTTHSTAGPVYSGCTQCVENVDFGNMDTYTQVLLLEVYALLEMWDKWDACFSILELKLVNEDGLLFLKDDIPLNGVYRYFKRCSPSEVINTGHLLSSIMKRDSSTQELRDISASLARTLSNQANSNGMYFSTLASAVAIYALTEYGKKYVSATTNVAVTVSRNGEEVFSISITEETKYQVITQQTEPIPGDYEVTAAGTGNPLVQINVNFYTKVDIPENTPFQLTVTADPTDCTSPPAMVNYTFTLSYTGTNRKCGMTLVRVCVLTGHTMARRYWPFSAGGICEVEDQGDCVDFYFDNVTSEPHKFSTPMYRNYFVPTMQSSSVTMTEFQTGITISAAIRHPCYPSSNPAG